MILPTQLHGIDRLIFHDENINNNGLERSISLSYQRGKRASELRTDIYDQDREVKGRLFVVASPQPPNVF